MSRRPDGCLTKAENESQKSCSLLELTSGARTHLVCLSTSHSTNHGSCEKWETLDGRVGAYLSRKGVFCCKLRNWHQLIHQCLPDRIKFLDLHGSKSDPEPKQQPQGWSPPHPVPSVTLCHQPMTQPALIITKHNATQTTVETNTNATLWILACISLTFLQIATVQKNLHLQSQAPMKNAPAISLGIII